MPLLRALRTVKPKSLAHREVRGLLLGGATPSSVTCVQKMASPEANNILPPTRSDQPANAPRLSAWMYSLPKILNCEYPGGRHTGEPSDTYAFIPANCLLALSPVIGIAQAMLEEVISGTRSGSEPSGPYPRARRAFVIQWREPPDRQRNPGAS
jgi:hypothetical protein